jgi:starch-binding outer membrane protein, SusD/RagB family
MKNKILSAIILLAISLSSCKKIVEGINTDPNNPQDATAITMLTGVQLANVIVQEGELEIRYVERIFYGPAFSIQQLPFI